MTFQDVLLNLGIGALGSIIATIIFIMYDKRKVKRKFSGPVGTYMGFGYENYGSGYEELGGVYIDIEKPISKATIQYQSENKLLLTLNEVNNSNQWSGIVAMETESYGSISWRYDILDGEPVDLKTHRFGFKRLMFLLKEEKKIVYLVGEEGFGKEILIENPEFN